MASTYSTRRPRLTRRIRLLLLAVAAVGWIAAGRAHFAARRAGDEETRSRLELRRNRFLLCSSCCANTFVFYTAYRFARRVLAGSGR